MKSRQILSYPAERPPQFSPLILVGTVHRFPPMAPILEGLIREINPSLITVEISPFSVKQRKKKAPLWRQKLEEMTGKVPPEVLEGLKRALRMPYEYEVPKKLGLCPVIPIDLGLYARKYLAELEALINDPPKEAPPIFGPEKEFALMRLFKEGLYWPRPAAEDLRREAFWAKKIRKFLGLKRPILHVGGWRHLPGLLNYFPESVAFLLEPDFSS